MMRTWRAGAILLLLASTLSADVLVLKSGARISGRVVDKGIHYEVTTDAGLRTFLRDEVEDVITSPKELLGDTEKTFEEAKKQYSEALALSNQDERNAKLKEALEKVRAVREALGSARELFPEDKHSELDVKLTQAMQLLRLLRERVTVDLAKKPEMINPRSSAGGGVALSTAIATLIDPALRADPAKRASAREAFRTQRADVADLHDLATAETLFLARPDAEWRLSPAALKSLQDYFANPWIRDAVKLTPAQHLEAAAWIGAQIAALRKAEPAANVDALVLFGAGHLGHAAPGPETEKAAKALGFIVQNGVPGTLEGFAVRDLDGWIASGDFDLAALAFTKEFRSIDTPAVRFVWAYALTCIAQAKKKGFDRPVSALNSIAVTAPAVKDHLAALAKSVKTAGVCSHCQGEGKLRCTNCHGVKEVRTACAKCGGKGKYQPPGLVIPPNANPRRFERSFTNCLPCKGSGFEKVLRCEKCKDGYLKCKQCDGAEKPAPEMGDICAAAPCPDCDGDGCIFRNVRWACPSCLGLGRKLTPKADPTKTLP
ncbi:MAG: hypothetical protein EHM91_09210 [Planctomycetota bacterium]|nr:MAG: hypothetical protein EHM91_09210 [Planctomycetota bacterium]